MTGPPQKKLPKNIHILRAICICGLLQAILLAVLIAVFLAFMIGSESMKENTLVMRDMTQQMLHLTRDMRNQTQQLGEFIQLAIPATEMNHIIRFAYSLVTSNATFQAWNEAYQALQSEFEQYENIMGEIDSPDVHTLIRDTFTTISLTNSAIPPLFESAYNITEGIQKLVAKLSKTHKVDLEF